MHAVGLSMALGAFLAGVLLAESEYRRELETDIEPFKGLLLGLFFIAVGMSIDFAVVLAQPLLIAAIVVGFLLLKAGVLWAMARTMPIPQLERPVFIILLAQGGEFGFVVFQTAAQAGVISAPVSSFLVAAVAISMLLTPLLLVAADRWWIPLLAGAQERRSRRSTSRRTSRSSSPASAATGRSSAGMLFANGVAADGARPRRRADRGDAPLRLARLLRRRDPARPDAHRRRRQGARHRRSRSTTSSRASTASTMIRANFPQRDDRRARAQRPALLRAATSSA